MAEPTLYVVATPIGNLRDITLRALDTLKAVDVIAAEDTRISRRLLAHYGIQAGLIAAHEHNEREVAGKLVDLLSQGKSVALISDAGTPSISDPGAIAVAEVRAAGFPVVAIPGACAITTAIAASGLPCASFSFHGFLPARKGERERILTALKARSEMQVFYEAPHRIVDSIGSIASVLGGDRRIGIARELTKLFEEVHVCRLGDAADWLQQSDDHRRGEFVLLVEGCAEAKDQEDFDDSGRALGILLDRFPLRQAVELAAEITGAKKNALYERALRLKKEGTESQ